MRSDLKRDFSAILGIVIFYVILQILGVTCPIKFITGISCPGCGMTRAWMALLRGDFSSAVMYHPLFWLPIPMVVSYVQLERGKCRRLHLAILTIAVILLFVVYFLRMFEPEDSVVVFCPREGLIVKFLTLFLIEKALKNAMIGGIVKSPLC